MPLPLTLEERIHAAVDELDPAERQLCQSEPMLTLLIFAKLQHPELYARVRKAIRGR
jgi:hypothetical protein